jgi:hypothetical protein
VLECPDKEIKVIVYGQALNVKMICSKEGFVEKHSRVLKDKFLERGYPCGLVEENFKRGANIPRV